ncbi:DUF6745 domain-containing protein [Fischerella thermalis]|uniref:DUF6745 domain-containing protein n=1 Tax=Fischerella thermalis CCMEE 5318 TaxID=2019666 RepID=A0A2N6L4E1_9CYAN|nr:hypothetical protein [Fischerella thermalis]PMB15214.1 hypothetical protein CEN46_26000 [Fischerella thermalis CCMEE 5318]PMB37312.1 hypothetical protein CEN47_07940 [Fischerella thermalis CCMEE 5319]
MSYQFAKLSLEQENLVPIYQRKWRNIALSTQRVDRKKAAEAVKEVYAFCGLATPEVVFCESPYEAMSKALPSCENLIIPSLVQRLLQLRLRILKLFPAQARYYQDPIAIQRPDNINVHIHTTLYYQFLSYMKSLEQQLNTDLGYLVELEIEVNLSALYHQLQNELGKQYDSNFIPAATFCSYCSWLEFWKSALNYTADQELLQLFQSLAKSCGWIFPYKRVAVVCDRPTKLCFDSNNRLHAEGETAIEFADGYNLYAYHGITLPEKYGKLHPQQWQAQWLLQEDNAELRRVLIQGIGYARIIEQLQASELDRYREYTLLKIENDVDIEPIYLLKMTCPSTGYIHVLRVPPNVQSAQEAITWANWGIAPTEFAMQT